LCSASDGDGSGVRDPGVRDADGDGDVNKVRNGNATGTTEEASSMCVTVSTTDVCDVPH
jgi:hypothetical protein